MACERQWSYQLNLVPLKVVGYHEVCALRMTLFLSNGNDHDVLLDHSLSRLPIFSRLSMCWLLWFPPMHPSHCVFLLYSAPFHPSSSLNCSPISFKTHGPSIGVLKTVVLLMEIHDSSSLWKLLFMNLHTFFKGLFILRLFHVSYQRIL